MLPEDETFLRYYSLAGLHERLRDDAALFPDTIDQRYGAWAQLLVLFRMVFDGAESGQMRLPARHGVLFDPDRFPFLEGRAGAALGRSTSGSSRPSAGGEAQRVRCGRCGRACRGAPRPARGASTRRSPTGALPLQLEFPEVFERENPGFDAIVGNPPFAGKNTTASANGLRYPDWLRHLHAESHGNADLVAHFFRRAFNLIRKGAERSG